MVLNGTMPASSHGLPTSSMRCATPPHFSQRIFTASMYGRCGELPSKASQPSTAFSFSSSRLPITAKCSQSPHTQIGSASPQKRFFEIIQSLMLRSQSSSRASPSGGIHLMLGHHALDAVAPIHADEPLVHRAEDQLFLAAPAVRINVRILFSRHQHAARLERGNHVVRHFVRIAFGELAEPIQENGAVIQRRDEGNSVLLAELLVLRAAARRDVDQSRAFGLADFLPGNHAMRFRRGFSAARLAIRKNAARRFLRRQFVERARDT